jgi:hypothetical protein
MTNKWGICPSDLFSVVTGIGKGRMHDEYQRDRTDINTVGDDDGDSNDIEDDEVAGRAVLYKIRSLKYSRDLYAPRGFGGGLKQQQQNERTRQSDSSRGGRSGINSDNSLRHVKSNSVWDSSASGTSYPDDRLTFTLGGELKFSLGVSQSEIESDDGKAFRSVLLGGIDLSINADELGYDVQIAKLVLADVEGGSTDVTVQFQLYPRQAMGVGEAKNAGEDGKWCFGERNG